MIVPLDGTLYIQSISTLSNLSFSFEYTGSSEERDVISGPARSGGVPCPGSSGGHEPADPCAERRRICTLGRHTVQRADVGRRTATCTDLVCVSRMGPPHDLLCQMGGRAYRSADKQSRARRARPQRRDAPRADLRTERYLYLPRPTTSSAAEQVRTAVRRDARCTMGG